MDKKIYIRFTNGSTTQLVDMYDNVRQEEVIADGFIMEMGDDNLPKTVDSSDLISINNASREQMLREIVAKHESKNAAMSAKGSLSAKYGNK